MNSKINLDSRLLMCADFVRKDAKLADIGTDHAYLPLWLCLSGKCPSAIAADINPEPLSRGEAAIKNANAENLVKTRLSNGLEKIASDEADDVVIAGMGGELISAILENCPYSKNPEKHFILQPMTKSEVLIKYLCDNGFEILRQDCCVAANKCYTVILTSYTGKAECDDEIFYYAGKLEPKNYETHKKFIEKHISKLDKQAKGDVHYKEIADKLREIIG